MSIEEDMSIDERRKYLHKMRIRYWNAKSRKERSELLDEMEAVTELHRKSLIRLVRGELARKPRRKQRGKRYGLEVKAAVQVIAESLDYPCAERLHSNLVWLALHLSRHSELKASKEVLEKLEQMSVSTLWRLLPRGEEKRTRLAHSKERPGQANPLRQAVPVRRIRWDETQPGHFEVDLVHHCGASADGQYVHTLQVLDVATGWSECAATLGRSFLVLEDGFRRILQRLPFPVLELHPDNGSEFFNVFLLKFWKTILPQVQLSRSRPLQKNDNRFVEENNFSLVRAYIGYQRLETVAQTALLNRLYDLLWLYHNFFQPVMRLQQKLPTSDPFHPKRVYQAAQTPFDRVCASGVLSNKQIRQLDTLRQASNPRQLRRSIELLLTQLSALPLARPGLTEDVRHTLGQFQKGADILGNIIT
jgi:hypothetical protein